MFPGLVPLWSAKSETCASGSLVGFGQIQYFMNILIDADYLKAACGIALAMNGDSSCSALKGTLVDMEEIAQNVQLLPEKTLQDIAKGPLVKFTQSCGDFE